MSNISGDLIYRSVFFIVSNICSDLIYRSVFLLCQTSAAIYSTGSVFSVASNISSDLIYRSIFFVVSHICSDLFYRVGVLVLSNLGSELGYRLQGVGASAFGLGYFEHQAVRISSMTGFRLNVASLTVHAVRTMAAAACACSSVAA